MRPDIRPGGTFPDYALPDHIGTVRTLGELQEVLICCARPAADIVLDM